MFDALLSRLGSLWTGLTGGNLLTSSVAVSAVAPQFVLRSTPDFTPLHAVLSRNGVPFPVVIEGADIPHARRVLEGELHREFENFLSATIPFEAVPWFALVRALDGTCEGIALSWLTGRGEGIRMRCDRVRKRVMEGDGVIRHVGLALLMAQLRWMKANGHWPLRGEILKDYDPHVMASYRRTCGMGPGFFDELTIATASVGRWDGERFLAQCPIPIRTIRATP
ncbi:MAG TPA: hypothetical protein VLJ37_05100 [bacterium]|nr:hypothetical protein [bacterium]